VGIVHPTFCKSRRQRIFLEEPKFLVAQEIVLIEQLLTESEAQLLLQYGY
jgi:hypothetical protein